MSKPAIATHVPSDDRGGEGGAPLPPPFPGGSEAAAEFLLRLRARGVRDLEILKAMEMVPRRAFVPRRYADLATRDVALPIPCGQTLPEPYFAARTLMALGAGPGHRVLEIGAGSGYVTALLSRLAGEVLALERYRGLATQARARLDDLRVDNAAVVWGDGLAVPAAAGLFDRILVDASLDGMPDSIAERLAPGGVVVYSRLDPEGGSRSRQLVRAERDDKNQWSEAAICPSRLQALRPGLSREL